MSRPAIKSDKLNPHITLSECHPDSACRTVNWWLYDKRACGGGMNVAMRAPSREAALLEAVEFWAAEAQKYKTLHAELRSRVDAFVAPFIEESEDGYVQ